MHGTCLTSRVTALVSDVIVMFCWCVVGPTCSERDSMNISNWLPGLNAGWAYHRSGPTTLNTGLGLFISCYQLNKMAYNRYERYSEQSTTINFKILSCLKNHRRFHVEFYYRNVLRLFEFNPMRCFLLETYLIGFCFLQASYDDKKQRRVSKRQCTVIVD